MRRAVALLLISCIVLLAVPMQIGFGQQKKAPEDYMWGINVFHPFSVPSMQTVGEFDHDVPNLLSDGHVGWVRFNIKWRDIMPRERWGIIPGQSDPVWTPYDTMITALREKGIKLLAIVACGQIDMVSKDPTEVGPDEYIRVAGELTRAIVERYKDKISIWQIENEVNAWSGHASLLFRFRNVSDSYWLNPTQNGFREQLMETLYRSVKAADENAKVAVAIHYGAWAWEIVGYHEAYIPKNYDILGLTIYSHYMNIIPPILTPLQVAADYVKNAIKFAEANGRPIIVVETGFPSGDFGVQRNSYWTQDGQRSFVSAFVDEAMDHTNVIIGFFYFKFRDTNPPGFSVSIGSQAQEDFFGLINYQGQPKLAWPSYGQKIVEYTPIKPAEVLLPYTWLVVPVVVAAIALAILVTRRRRKRPQTLPTNVVEAFVYCINCGRPRPQFASYCSSCGSKQK